MTWCVTSIDIRSVWIYMNDHGKVQWGVSSESDSGAKYRLYRKHLVVFKHESE